MALGISLIMASLIGLIFGIINQNKALITSAVIALIIVTIIWMVYSYLYSLTPY